MESHPYNIVSSCMCLSLFLGSVQFSIHLFVIVMLVNYYFIYRFTFEFWYMVEQISIQCSLNRWNPYSFQMGDIFFC